MADLRFDTADQPPDEFEALLADLYDRLKRQGTGALAEFGSEHPGFARRLGNQADQLFAALAAPQEDLPASIGGYRVQRRLGVGGMGTVYLAEQTEPFRRLVALKVVDLVPGNLSRLTRFATEIQTLALLNHDGIARIYEAGTDQGRPYFSMEYVPGRPITDFCAEEGLGLRARLQLFITLCQTVDHAHRQGILHRDLKPSNVLVHGPPDAPVVKVIDFGLARVVADLPGPRQTRTDDLFGTRDYISPEQVAGGGTKLVDTRADVYALGVVLYELLTGTLPLSLWRESPTEPAALWRMVLERQPDPPSVRVAKQDARDGAPPWGGMPARRLARALAGDLDCIAMKALAKLPDDRYGSVAQLADDLRRHLRFEPVAARPPRRGYLARRFIRRNRAVVAFTGTTLVLVIGSLVTIAAYAVEGRRHLEHGNLLGLVRFVEQLQLRDKAWPPPARPAGLPALREWQRDFEGVLALRGRMQAFVDAPDDGADASNPADWISGRNAQHELRQALGDTLKQLATMTAAGGYRDRVLRRIEWAERVRSLTVEQQQGAWQQVQRRIRENGRYPGLDLKPQVGLVPLGTNAEGYEEFALPMPGLQLPKRISGRFVIDADCCPVFVLLPGGRALVGSQRDDAHMPHFDAEREDDFEEPVQEVRLPAFFASKYELTNAQFEPFDGMCQVMDPTHPLQGPCQPVCYVDLQDALHVLHAFGMRLPTSAEWEYMARGGSADPRWCGAEASTLEGKENLYDQSTVAEPGVGGEGAPVSWTDGFPVSAPVGSLRANGFGLYDVLGNVREVAVRAQHPNGDMEPELRGSSWHEGSRAARATSSIAWAGQPLWSIGFRPVISLEQ